MLFLEENQESKHLIRKNSILFKDRFGRFKDKVVNLFKIDQCRKLQQCLEAENALDTNVKEQRRFTRSGRYSNF